MSETLKEGAVPGTSFHCSGNGWITQELFLEWFRFFIANIPPTRPVLLIQDGHASHTTIEVIELASSSNIHILCLPAHTTHILQSLDVAVFKSFKSHYWKECRRYLAAHPRRIITSEVIAALLGKSWPLSVTPINIMAGFKKSGSYPLNPGVVHDRQLMPSKTFHSEPEGQVLETHSGDSPTSPSCSMSDASPTSLANPSSCTPDFTAQEEERYCRQYEEGYDLPDPAYMAWLAVRHPEVTSHPSSIATHLSGGHPESVSEPESSSDVSDALNQILMLPEPRPSKKRKPALTSRAVTITDCEILDGMKAREEEKAKKEVEKQARKVEREQKKKEPAADKAKKDAEKQARKVEWEQKKKDQEQIKQRGRMKYGKGRKPEKQLRKP